MDVKRTVLLHTSDGVIKISPQGGRTVRIKAPAKVRISDRKGRGLYAKDRNDTQTQSEVKDG